MKVAPAGVQQLPVGAAPVKYGLAIARRKKRAYLRLLQRAGRLGLRPTAR